MQRPAPYEGVSLERRTGKAEVFALLREHFRLARRCLNEYSEDMRTTPSRQVPPSWARGLGDFAHLP
jgi:hypothetical protein